MLARIRIKAIWCKNLMYWFYSSLTSFVFEFSKNDFKKFLEEDLKTKIT